MDLLSAKIGSPTGLIVFLLVFIVTAVSQGFLGELGKRFFERSAQFLKNKAELLAAIRQASKELLMELIKHFILPGIYGVFFIYALLFFFGEKIGVPKEKWIPLIGGMLLTTIVTMVFSASYFMIQELLVYCWKQLWKIGASLNHSKD